MNRSILDFLICPYSKSPLTLESFEAKGDEVEYGILQSEAGDFPVLAGIPILFLGRTDLVERLRAGRFKEALALAAIGPAPAAGVWRTSQWLQDTYRLRTVGNWLERPRQAAWLRRVQHVMTPSNGSRPSVRRLFEFAYRECRIRSAEVFNYNYYRYSIPRHLVALSFVQALAEGRGPVLDLACGAGHITWALQRRVAPERQVIGLDGFFFSLYAARTRIAPDAWHVCGDVNALPFRSSLFSSVFCSDAFFNFSAKWSCLREIERILSDSGELMLVCLRNKLRKHLYPGRPLSPAGYRTLVKHLRHCLLPDSLILRCYLDGNGLPAAEKVDDGALAQEDTISLWATKGEREPVNQGRFERWPHADGTLGINPLYTPERSSAATYVRHLPSDFYAEENREMMLYLPERFELSSKQQSAIRENRLDGLEGLVRGCAVLAFPPDYLD